MKVPKSKIPHRKHEFEKHTILYQLSKLLNENMITRDNDHIGGIKKVNIVTVNMIKELMK